MILIKYNVVLLYMENKKKRKFSDIVSCFHGTKEHIKLKIMPIDYLPCEICNNPVYNYKTLNDCIVCSYDCYSIMYLRRSNKYLHEKDTNKSFNDMEYDST